MDTQLNNPPKTKCSTNLVDISLIELGSNARVSFVVFNITQGSQHVISSVEVTMMDDEKAACLRGNHRAGRPFLYLDLIHIGLTCYFR